MQHADILALAGLRIDGRRPSELRNIRFKVGSQNSSDGSCYIEHGLNKILVSIHGPQETKKRIAEQQLFNEQGILVCEVFNAPFSGTERKKRNGSDKRSIEIENMIKQTFEPIILLELYQHSEISISVCIFEIDGSIESSILNACTMALMDAGIAMNDMVIACSAGVIKQQLCQDLNALEQSACTSYFPLAISSRTEEIIYMQLESRIAPQYLEELIAAGIEGCRKLKQLMTTEIKTYMQDTEIIN